MRRVVTLGVLVASACSGTDSAKNKLSRPGGNTGGTSMGAAGKGSGGTKMGGSGEGGEAASASGAGSGGAGASGGASGAGASGGTNSGSGGDGEAGSDNGSGGTTGGSAAGRSSGGRASGGQGGSSAGSSGSGQEAGVGGEGSALPAVLYVSVTGVDTASGARPDPFETLAHAASVAEFGDTIIFLDGDFDFGSPVAPVNIPAGVDVIAENPGGVFITSGGGPLMNLEGSTQIDGIEFQGFGPVLTANSETDSTVRVTNSSFFECDAGFQAIEAGGNATVLLLGENAHDWGNCPGFAVLRAGAHMIFNGGELQFQAAAAYSVFVTEDDSRLEIFNLTAVDGDAQFLAQYDDSQVTITYSTIMTSGNTGMTVNGAGALTLQTSALSIDPDTDPAYACIQNNMNGVGEISLYDSRIHDCSQAINGVPPGVLTIDGTEIYDMAFDGLEFSTGAGGVMTIADSHFHDTDTFGARLFGGGGGANILALTVRNTIFEGATECFRIQGAIGSTWDLGTMAEAGGNTFLASATAIRVLTVAGTEVSAVGNAWTPNVQGADAGGHYAATTGTSLEVTSGDGLNYNVPYGATLKLAQSP